MSSLHINTILSTFIGRTDVIAVTKNGRHNSVKVTQEECEQTLSLHLAGKQRAGIYNLLSGDVVRFAVVDFDSHTKDESH